MQVRWNKCSGGVWCKLATVNLDHDHFDEMEGVYVIWHGGADPHTVYVGQGVIRDRLRSHRDNERIQKYANLGLYVTWAAVDRIQMNGVECSLYQQLNPREVEHTPDAPAIQVNLPW